MRDPLTLELLSASKSVTGNIRTVNEDACIDIQEHRIWAVADGMGGHQAGDFASKLITQSLSVIEQLSTLEETINEAVDSLTQVNSFLVNEAAHRGGSQTIGSTVVVLIAHKNQAAVLWVGDSRLYLLRDGELKQLTKDHSKVQELVDLGVIKAEDAEMHPSANVITRAIGASEPVKIDIEQFEIQAGDVYLICSDGLYKELNEAEIGVTLAENSCRKVCDKLIDMALQRECRDNVTAIVIEVLVAERTMLRA